MKGNRVTEVLVETSVGAYGVRIWFDERHPSRVWESKDVLNSLLKGILTEIRSSKGLAAKVVGISGVHAAQVTARMRTHMNWSVSYVVYK